MNEEVFFIVYPSGDKSRLSVASVYSHCMYEKSDYALASRKDFYDEKEAVEYCRKLARENNLLFDGDSKGNYYLD
jgi:hypothetical protein